jgi:hypothetical protein
VGLHSPRISPAEAGHGAFDGTARVAHNNGGLPGARSEPPAKNIHQNATVHQQAMTGSEHRFVRRHFGGRREEHNRLLARQGRREGSMGWVGGVFWFDAFYDLLESAFGAYDADDFGDQRSGPDEAGASACREAVRALDFPFDEVQRTLRPSADQQAKLEDLKIATHRAANALKASCRAESERTAVGRLDTVARRLTAILNAVHMVREPLASLYGSLSDEQRARFDHMRMPGSRTAASVADQPRSRSGFPPDPSAVGPSTHELDTTILASEPQRMDFAHKLTGWRSRMTGAPSTGKIRVGSGLYLGLDWPPILHNSFYSRGDSGHRTVSRR